ncbi:MAG: DNA-protecting protein DprA [Clostridiales bacterium]|nr:DNA-protecting protein DprA [Clostridiales bacterium]
MADKRELLCQAWLSCSESLGYQARLKLMEEFKSASAVYDRFSSKMMEIVGEKAFAELADLRQTGLDKMEAALNKSDIQLCVPGDSSYPEQLAHIPDPPALLFYQGTLFRDEQRAIAIVGSRRETRYGREQAYQIARELAQNGVTIISGLARGIDTAAHKGALDAGGRTIAILGSGIKRVYPRENEELAAQITKNGGAVVSEFSPASEPLAFHFPVRNRLVSGFSHGVLLVEAREKSGTLITVGHALMQGREVFALPGPVDAPGSAVPNRMLREGARLITCAGDILEDMSWGQSTQGEQTSFIMPDLTNEQRRLYDSLCDEPLDFSELMQTMKLQAQELNVLLTTLEMENLIEALPGRMFKAIRQ